MSEPMGRGYRHRQSEFWDGYASLLRWVGTDFIKDGDGKSPWVPIVTEMPRQPSAVKKSLERRLGDGVEIRRTRDGGLEARWIPPQASPQGAEIDGKGGGGVST